MCSLSLLGVLFKYACVAFGRTPCIRAHLRRLATIPREKCGLAGLFSLALTTSSPAQEVDPAQVQDLYAHSLQVAEETRRKVPKSSKPIFDLGRVHQRFGFDDRAVEAYREGLRRDPQHPEVLADIGFLLSQRFQDQALAAYREALRLDPEFPQARTRIGLILTAEGRHPQAIEEFRTEISNRSATALTYMLLGHALKDLGKFPEAIRSYREAIRMDPGERGAHYGLAEALKALGLIEESSKALLEFRKLKSREAQETKESATKGGNREEQLRFTALSYFDAAQTYLQANLAKDSERSLRLAVRFDPTHAAARKLLVDLLRQAGRIDEAILECREILAHRRAAEWLFLLAGLSTEKEAYGEAARLLEEVIRVEGEESDAHRELARLILRGKVPGDPARAAELARRAVEVSPAAVNYDILGWALFQRGDVPGALEALETAVRLEPANPAYKKRLLEMRRRVE